MMYRCISLWQPWASLVALGEKRFETRSWDTDYRGPLAIHAAQKIVPFRDMPDSRSLYAALPVGSEILELPRGAIIAVCDLMGTFPAKEAKMLHSCSLKERAFGNYAEGRFAWWLENVRILREPLYCRGYQSFWSQEIADDLLMPEAAP